MKQTRLLWAALFLFPTMAALADNPGHDRDNRATKENDRPAPARQKAFTAPAAPARQPVIINMSRPTSGGHDQNFPSQQNTQPAANLPQPSYGRLNFNNWKAPAAGQPQPRTQGVLPSFQSTRMKSTLSDVRPYAGSGQQAAVAVHHHPYTPGYVRKKLQKLGVTQEPALITDRAQMIHTARRYSTIQPPNQGLNGSALHATAVSPRHYNDEIVRDHMALVDSSNWHARIQGFNSSEFQRNHYYWHADNSFNYCHYIDNQGYHWWGWYVGDQFFWNRYYGGRWWWYDPDFDRWCFWNEGFWWWQDPYHVGDIYCYNNDAYIPCNSANDQEVVTEPSDENYHVYNAPDGSCVVRVLADTQDAFLYDTDDPNATHPIYLASGVESVSFSDTSTGRSLEVLLKLNDGSFDLFDDDGNPYGPGQYDADQAAQDGDANAGDTPPPAPSQIPPSDDNSAQ